MKKAILSLLILMIMWSCGSFRNSDKPLTENEKLENVFGEFKIHYQRLLTFKNNSDFKTKGFAAGGLITEWLHKVNKLKENPDAKLLLLKKSIDVADLKVIGLAYAESKGQETGITKRINTIFEKAINQNEEISTDSLNHSKYRSVFELFSQFPNENLLYPSGIKDNPVINPYEETYVDSAVHPKSITGLDRVYSYVSEPTYMIFRANSEKNKHIGLVIFPGGGFKNIWLDKEGTDIAFWLSEQGVTCMVVKYRTNRKDPDGDWLIDVGDYLNAIYQDAKTSIHIMKGFSDSLNFDKNKIGMMGFSAGGLLTERIVYKYHDGNNEWSPNFAALIYHGNNLKVFKKVKNKEKLPPFFMAVAKNDYRLTYEKVIPYLKMISTEVKNSELHIYPDGGHGFGLAYDESSAVSEWKNEFVKWLDHIYK